MTVPKSAVGTELAPYIRKDHREIMGFNNDLLAQDYEGLVGLARRGAGITDEAQAPKV